MTSKNEQTTVLVLRDTEGNYFLLTEEQIQATRATPEQQAALREKIGDQDVSGYAVGAAGYAGLGTLNINVNPQVNVQTGLNVAAANFAPVNQTLGQGAINSLISSQR